MNDYIKESFDKTRIAGSIASGALDEVAKIAAVTDLVAPSVTSNSGVSFMFFYS